MVFEKKQLSKVLAIALMIACAVAFMPLLSGQAFAASKKVTGVKASVKGTSATVSWTAFKGATKYKVKLTGAKKQTVTVSKTKKAFKNLPYGDYKVKVKAIKGKKSSWSKWVKFTVKAPIDNVVITGTANVGATLTANVTNAAGEPLTEGVAYQWYRVNTLTGVVAAISGATESSYQIAAVDGGYTIFVEATAGGKTIASDPTKAVTDTRALASAEVVLPNGHTAPQLSDELSVKVLDTLGDEVTGNVTYQWYVGGKKVKGETGKKYTLPDTDINKGYVGKVVTVVVTAAEDQKAVSGEVTSAATAPIIKSTVPEGVEVKKSAAAPFVGETLEAVFTPEGTSDADATYQWFRGTFKIAGATDAKYTVTKSDEGSVLSVKVKLSTDTSESEYTTGFTAVAGEVKAALKGHTVALAAKDKSGKRAAVFTRSDIAEATITDQDKKPVTDLNNKFSFKWYIDSVADENLLYTGVYDQAAAAAREDYTQPTDYNNELNLHGKYYLAGVVSEKDTVNLVGHKLVAVASTKAVYGAQGSVESPATAAVQIQLAVKSGEDAMAIKGDTGAVYMATKTTLSVENGPYALYPVDKDAVPTVSYQWYKTTVSPSDLDFAPSDWVAIEGATSETYAIAKDDEGVKDFKVAVTGTGDYYGGPFEATLGHAVTNNDPQSKLPVDALITNGENPAAAAVDALPGDVLTASASVAKAVEPAISYAWTFEPKGESKAKAATGTGATYTVPADAERGDTVTLSIVSNVSDFASGQSAVATVKTAITSVTITSESTWQKSMTEEGHDGVAYPNVGETLNATAKAGTTTIGSDGVTFEWYADGVLITDDNDEAVTGTSKVIGVDDFGKVITAKAIGKGNYNGSTAVSGPTGTVSAIGALGVDTGLKQIEADTPVKVGEMVTAHIGAYIYDRTERKLVPADVDLTTLARIAWNVGGAQVGTEVSYKFGADDEGSAWTCEASGIEPAAEGALIFSNGLAVYPADTLPEVASIEYTGGNMSLTKVNFGSARRPDWRWVFDSNSTVAGKIVAYDQFKQVVEDPTITMGTPKNKATGTNFQRVNQYGSQYNNRYYASSAGTYTVVWPVTANGYSGEITFNAIGE